MNDFQPPEFALTAIAGSVPAVAPTLVQLEQVIERALQTFLEVGRALAEISGRRLYRELGCATFEEYCEKRWSWHRRTAYKYIAAFEVAQNVPSRAHEISFTQARELAVLSPEQQREVAVDVDFSTTTIRELKERIRRARPMQSEEFPEPDSNEPDECQTPPEIIERALRVLQCVDLDPCAGEASRVPAKERTEGPIDGLSVPWSGRVYLNPPYDQPISIWVEKLCTEQFEGNLTEAVAVLPAQVEASWFRLLHDCAICFVEEQFGPDHPRKPAPFPRAVVYLGGDIAKFHAAFRDLGDIWVRWKRGGAHQCNGGAR